jgi:hypothetical protein
VKRVECLELVVRQRSTHDGGQIRWSLQPLLPTVEPSLESIIRRSGDESSFVDVTSIRPDDDLRRSDSACVGPVRIRSSSQQAVRV